MPIHPCVPLVDLPIAPSLPDGRPFTAKDAAAAGLTRHALRTLVESGAVRRILRGVYASAHLPDSPLLRAQALALVAPPGSVATDWTACWYWTGVHHPSAQDSVPPLSVFRFRGHDRLRTSSVSSGQRWLKPSDVVPLADGLAVTTPLRTVWDLGRFSHRILAIGGMDALVRAFDLDRAQVVEGVERFARQRGVRQLRFLAPLIDGRSESTGESALRLRWLEMPDLPRPEPQVRILGPDKRELYRLDLGVRELRYAAEYDGEEHHSSEQDRAADETRRTVLNEMHHWTVEAFRRENVFGATEDASYRIRRGVDEARRRHRRG